MNTLITIIFIGITTRAEPHITVVKKKKKKRRHQSLLTENRQTDMLYVRLKNNMVYAHTWICRHSWRKNLEVSMGTLPSSFPGLQLPGCYVAGLQVSRARQSTTSGAAQWCQGQMHWGLTWSKAASCILPDQPINLFFWGRTGSHQERLSGGLTKTERLLTFVSEGDKVRCPDLKSMLYFNQWKDEGMAWKHHVIMLLLNLIHRNSLV